MSAFTDEVVRLCRAELEFFGDGKLKEYDKAAYKRVGTYWNALALEPDLAKWKNYNGRSDCKLKLDAAGEVVRVISNNNQPWSAAFISWVARGAGAGKQFSYSSAHAGYILKALAEAKKATSKAKFIARRRTAYRPKVGDLIACERLTSADPTFDNYADYVKAGRYEAHCDFVVGANGDGTKLLTIGGNVGHSVKQKLWPINSKGLADKTDPTNPDATVICIIECLL